MTRRNGGTRDGRQKDREDDRHRKEPRVVVAMISRNEEAAVGQVLDEIKEAAPDAKVLMVDSSTDRTAEIAEARGAEVIRQVPPRGFGPAMMRVLKEAATRGDVVVTMDCDATYPAGDIRKLVDLVWNENYDIANGSRLGASLLARPLAMPLANWAGNATFAVATRVLHGLPVSDVHSGMRAYRSSVLRDVDFFAEAAALPVELLIKPARLGYRVVEVPIAYKERIGQTTLHRFDSTMWTFRRLGRAFQFGRRVKT